MTPQPFQATGCLKSSSYRRRAERAARRGAPFERLRPPRPPCITCPLRQPHHSLRSSLRREEGEEASASLIPRAALDCARTSLPCTPPRRRARLDTWSYLHHQNYHPHRAPPRIARRLNPGARAHAATQPWVGEDRGEFERLESREALGNTWVSRLSRSKVERRGGGGVAGTPSLRRRVSRPRGGAQLPVALVFLVWLWCTRTHASLRISARPGVPDASVVSSAGGLAPTRPSRARPGGRFCTPASSGLRWDGESLGRKVVVEGSSTHFSRSARSGRYFRSGGSFFHPLPRRGSLGGRDLC